MSEQASEKPVVRKTVTVDAPVETAFRIFTTEMERWWPFKGHSLSDDPAATAVFEGRPGGRWLERAPSGEEFLWGTVVTWEPPHRLVTRWHPGRGEETAQELEIRFIAEGDRTRVELEHRGWEKLGDEMPEIVRSYERGWERILGERYAAVVGQRSAAAGPVGTRSGA